MKTKTKNLQFQKMIRFNRYTLSLLFVLMSIAGFAQEASSSAGSSNFYPKLGLYLLVGMTLALVAFTLSVLFRLINDLLRQKETEKSDGDSAAEPVASTAKAPSLIMGIYQKLTEAVPVEREDEVLLDHNYDGIRELDNRLPPWWLGLFYGTIAFGVFYIGYYHIAGKGLSSAEAWEEEVTVAKAQVDQYLATQAEVVDENNVTLLTDQADLDAGELTYTSLCATCHLANGAGLVGPNLTDQYWVHGGDIKDVFRVIKYGIPEKGMIAWSSQLRPAQMQQVASYILKSLVGTSPPNPKEPQGELYQPEAQ